MSSLKERGTVHVQGLYEQSATQKHPLGHAVELFDGRRFTYAKNGATTGVAGNLYSAPDIAATGGNITLHVNQSVVAAAIGQKYIDFVLGATALTADYYQDGFLGVNDGTGEGVTYKISGHAAASASATVRINLYDPVIEALVASATSEASLFRHPNSYAVIHGSPPVNHLIGVAVRDFTADYYGFYQTRGPCMVLTEGTLIKGEQVIASLTADGAFAPVTTTYDEPYAAIGRCIWVGATTEYSLVNLNIF